MAKAAFFRRPKLGGTSGDEALVLGAFGCGYFGPLDLGSFFLFVCVGFSVFFYWTIFFWILDFGFSDFCDFCGLRDFNVFWRRFYFKQHGQILNTS